MSFYNIITRKSLKFKKYFISPINILTSKKHFQIKYDIPKELLYEKIIEVINHSNLSLVDTSSANYEILANKSLSFISWGENICIIFESEENNSIMKFYSTTLFSVTSLGKNEKNYHDLLNEIENSLTV